MSNCDHRTTDGHCEHLIMADGGSRTSETLCPFPTSSQGDCRLNSQVVDETWLDKHEKLRRAIYSRKSPHDTEVALQTLLKRAVPDAVAKFRALQSSRVNQLDRLRMYDMYLTERPQYRRRARTRWGLGAPTCDLFNVWTVNTCVEPRLNCRACPIAHRYHELLRELRPQAVSSGLTGSDLINTAKVEAIKAYFSRHP